MKTGGGMCRELAIAMPVPVHTKTASPFLRTLPSIMSCITGSYATSFRLRTIPSHLPVWKKLGIDTTYPKGLVSVPGIQEGCRAGLVPGGSRRVLSSMQATVTSIEWTRSSWTMEVLAARVVYSPRNVVTRGTYNAG